MKPEQNSNYWQHEDDPEAEVLATEPQVPDLQQSGQPEPAPESETPKTLNVETVHWTASEYIHEEKNGLWFVLFGLIVAGFVAADIFLLKSYTFSALVVVMAVALIIYTRRPPRSIEYTLSPVQGLYVGEKLHSFSEFKAFGLIKDGDHHSIMLVPAKRFAQGVSVYFPEESGEKIVDILGSRLPMEDLKLDAFDILVRKLRL